MAKRNNPDKRRQDLLDELRDEPYFDEDLDAITRNLPTEEEYLPADEEDVPAAEPTEGYNRLGVRMIGLPVQPESEDDSGFTPAYDTEDDAGDLLPPRRRSARQAPEASDAILSRIIGLEDEIAESLKNLFHKEG